MDLQWEKSPHLEAHYEGQEKHQQRRTMKAKKNMIEEGTKDTMNDDHIEACTPPPSHQVNIIINK